MPRSNPIDSDPGVIAARVAAAERAELADRLATVLNALRYITPDIDTSAVPAIATRPADLVDLLDTLSKVRSLAHEGRDLVVHLARALPETDRPSWQQLATAAGEPDRNNLARRYRTRKATTDE